MGLAERGKVGIPPSSSECSSNSSVEASIESNTGLINGEKKGKETFLEVIFIYIILPLDRRLIHASMTKPHDTLRETRIDNRVDRRHSNSSSRYNKVIHQDSFDDIPDFNSNNQDVRHLIRFII